MAFFNKDSAADDAARSRWELLAGMVQTGIDNFRKIGRALTEIRDKELFRFEYSSFAVCCEERWKITTSHANRLITASTLAELLTPTGVTPTSERQIRPLAGLAPEDAVAAWTEAAAEGSTTDAVERAAEKRRPRARKAKKLRPTRLRVPGAWIIIEPNKKFSGVIESLEYALKMLREQMDDEHREAA